jgi:hypothetical protein
MARQPDSGQDDGISHNDCIQMSDSAPDTEINNCAFKAWSINQFANPPESCTRDGGPHEGDYTTGGAAGGYQSSCIQINGTSTGADLRILNSLFDGASAWPVNLGDPGPNPTVLQGCRFVRLGQRADNRGDPVSGTSRLDTNKDNRFTDNNQLIPGSVP